MARDGIRAPERFADRVGQALGREHFTARQSLAQAKVDTIRLTVAQLLLIGAQRRTWERRMGQLLLGAPRRRGGALPSQAERDRGQALPGGELYLCQVPYNEAVHVANRTRALHPAA